MILFVRITALVWGLWWSCFGLISAIAEKLDILGIFVHTTVPGLIFLITALYCFKSEFTAPVLLIAEGIFVLIIYVVIALGRFPLTTLLFVLVTMALPPVLSGTFLVVYKIRKILEK